MPHTGSILVVDNESAIVDVLIELLTDEGYVVYSALNGVAALAAVSHHMPALIVMDMRMPGMSGAELIARIRGAGLAPIPAVLMTAARIDAEALLLLGFSELLTKPFDLDDVLACVARYVYPSHPPNRLAFTN